MASHTFSVSSRSRRAPTGQWVMHWPQRAQSASVILRLPLTLTVVLEPVLVTSQMPSPCTLSQTWMQRMHLMHFSVSRMSGKLLSHGECSIRSLNGRSMMFRSLESVCRVQLPLRTQVAHLKSCWDRISCTFCFLAMRTFGLLVRISSPSCTLLLQAVTSFSLPVTSTRQTRQAAISLMSFK